MTTTETIAVFAPIVKEQYDFEQETTEIEFSKIQTILEQENV